MLRLLSLTPAIVLVFQALRGYGLSDLASAAGGFITLSLPVLILNIESRGLIIRSNTETMD